MEIVGVCGDHLAMWQDYAQSQLSQGELGLIEVKTMGVNDFNGVGNSIYFSWFLRVREGFRGWSMDLQDYQYNEGFGVLSHGSLNQSIKQLTGQLLLLHLWS